MPARFGIERVEREPGLLGDLAPHAAVEIDRRADHVVRVGRAGGKIDAAGIRRVRAP